MRTGITTPHEEAYSDGSRTLGILYNYDLEGDWKDSLTYIYKEGAYIFFNTMVEMMDYLLYSEKTMTRAYMEEDEFDELYDAECVEGKFRDKLTWR